MAKGETKVSVTYGESHYRLDIDGETYAGRAN
jgi:hypothetical protein